jgi:hypothetical protein
MRKQLSQNAGMSRPQSVGVSNSRRIQSVGPRVSRTATSFRVAHRELVIPSIPGSATFAVQSSLNLNPGLAATFPWLAPQAGQWEQYTVHKLHAVYIPIAPTSTAGDVTLSPDYDASDPQPTTEQQLSDNKDTVEDSVWQNLTCVLNRTSMMGLGPRKFVRPCNVAGDIKTFDVGKLFVATNNGGSGAVGKLWLEYDFEFFVPQNSPSPATVPQQTSQFLRALAQTFTSTTPAPLQFLGAVAGFDPLGVGNPASGVFTPAAGCYRVAAGVTMSDNASETFTFTIQFYKNGAAVGQLETYYNAALTGGDQYLSLEQLIPMNGTDTLQFEITATGVAGTLTSLASSPWILFSLA